MNKINLKYYKNKYVMLYLLIFALAVFAVICVFILTNDLIGNILEKNHIVLSFIIVLLAFLSSTIIITGVGSKIFSKNIQIIIYDDYFEIDSLEKYYYNNIIKCNLKTIKDIDTGFINQYSLELKLNNKKNIKYNIFTGGSKKEKLNVENLLIFYNELKQKIGNK